MILVGRVLTLVFFRKIFSFFTPQDAAGQHPKHIFSSACLALSSLRKCIFIGINLQLKGNIHLRNNTVDDVDG